MAKRENPEVVSDINVVPMVDIMLVLLIIFMVVTPMLSKGVSVDMVKVRNPIAMNDADKEDAILVAVMRDGRVFLDTTMMTPEQLTQKVQDMLVNKLSKTVYLKVDARARYERVVEVVDNLRAAGVDNLGLLTDQVKDKTQEGAEGTAAPASPGA